MARAIATHFAFSILIHPGFTYPSFNKDAPIEKLTWAPEADERERIDYMYFKSLGNTLKLKDIKVVGPEISVRYAQKHENDGKDQFMRPKDVWPSDHKGLLATFTIN